MRPAEFIAAIAQAARAVAKTTGVPASVSIAQAALESGWGGHCPGNNLFGIKADAAWHGPVTEQTTAEVIRGRRIAVIAKFRAYPDWQASIEDHAGFIKSNPRYAACFACETAEGFATGLQQAGYATDPHYAGLLTSLMRQYDLDQFDA